MPHLEARGLAKRYGEVQALHPTDFDVEPGETAVLIGSSGSGKSTLLRLLLGLIAPDAGTTCIGGVEMTEASALALRRRIGYVTQDAGLFPHLTARQNAALMASHLAWPREEVEARLAELCELTHLDADLLDHFPAQLSSGQRQRVGLMRALVLDPELLLLDEPLGALDPLIRAELRGDLREIFRRLGKSVVLVTHDVGEAAFFADRVAIMREGRIVQTGVFADLLERPADPFVTRFIDAQRSAAL